jgi:hypothetical protein
VSNTDTGGPAFPMNWVKQEAPNLNVILEQRGMSLRDYFAAKAMQATVQAWISTSQYPSTDFDVAANAYAVADAMLEARKE